MDQGTFNGSANPGGASTTGFFRYSTSNPGTCNNTFGTRVPTSGGTALGSGTSAVPFNQTVSTLSAAGTVYFYCALVMNARVPGSAPCSRSEQAATA